MGSKKERDRKRGDQFVPEPKFVSMKLIKMVIIKTPLAYLVGAGLADDGVRGREIVLPKAEIPPLPVTLVMVVPPTDKRVGRELELGVPVRRRCGIRDWDKSSEMMIELLVVDNECTVFVNGSGDHLPVLSRDSDDP